MFEVTGGLNYSKQSVYHLSQADLDVVQRSIVGIPDFFPPANPQNLIPNITVAGSNALPNNRASRRVRQSLPVQGDEPHVGLHGQPDEAQGLAQPQGGAVRRARAQRPARRASTFNGALQFDVERQQPTRRELRLGQHAAGRRQPVPQSDAQPFAEGRFNQIEFFVQDNWRVNRKLTLDLGVRFVHVGPTYVAGQKVAYFDPAKYDPAKAPVLYQPVCLRATRPICSGTQRMARNPLTGELVNQTYIGKFVPGSGDFANGMVVTEGTPPQFENMAYYSEPARRVRLGRDRRRPDGHPRRLRHEHRPLQRRHDPVARRAARR